MAQGCVRGDVSPWNETTLAKLHVLYGKGLSTAEIGRQLGLSKNAVVGKAAREGLHRPSPIASRPGGIAYRAGRGTPKLNPVALPPLGPAVEDTRLRIPRVNDGRTLNRRNLRATKTKKVAPEPEMPLEPAANPSAAVDPDRQCRWPIGVLGRADFRFCPEPRGAGRRNYCDMHHAKAHRTCDRAE